MSDKPMRLVMDLDYSLLICPCGRDIRGDGCTATEWIEFKKNHSPHTNGRIVETTTDRGATVYAEHPAAKEYLID